MISGLTPNQNNYISTETFQKMIPLLERLGLELITPSKDFRFNTAISNRVDSWFEAYSLPIATRSPLDTVYSSSIGNISRLSASIEAAILNKIKSDPNYCPF